MQRAECAIPKAVCHSPINGERPQKVKVTAQNRYGKEIHLEGTDLLARAFCHEIDHLNGVVFVDLADEMLEKDK